MKPKIILIILVILTALTVWNCKRQEEPNFKSDEKVNKESININIGSKQKDLFFNFDKVTTPERKRNWSNYTITKRLKIGSIENNILLLPSRTKIDENGTIYILDWADCSVKQFNRKGKYLKKYGKKGKGPGEFTQAADFDISENGKVVILGPNDNKFAVFEDTDEFIESKCSLMPIKLCFVSPTEVATFQMLDPVNESLFNKTNYIDGNISEYQNIFDWGSFGNANFGMLPFVIGDIYRNSSNNLVYISSIMGYVISYNANRKIENVFKLIDAPHKSGLAEKGGKINGRDAFFYPKKEEYLFRSSNIFGDKLFVFHDEKTKEGIGYPVDVYSLDEGEYKYSLLLKSDEKPIYVFTTNEKIAVVKENTEVEILDYKTEIL